MRPSQGRSAVGLFVACLALVGCENQYSAERIYPVRTDPVIKNGQKLTEERLLPDRPGQLPVMSIKDFTDQLDESHPFYRADPAKRKDFLTQDLVRDVGLISAEDRKILQTTLDSLYGKPREPKVVIYDDAGNVDQKTTALLKLEPETLVRGSVLYREHCLHCHGVTGDGRGPTGKWVNPHPRDLRAGLFKFTSVNRAEKAYLKAHRNDLARTLRQGVEGTAMPSFNLLAESQIQDLVSYVIHLAVRGETEVRTFIGAFEAGDMKMVEDDLATYITDTSHKNVVKAWKDSQAPQNQINVPTMSFDPQDPANEAKLRESVQRGKKLFEDKKTNCNGCHVNYGRQAPYKADDWGTLSRPRNLTQGIFRGGRRDTDLYFRIHSGIVGSGMNNFGKELKSDDIWDLVNFVRVVSYPEMRKKLGVEIPE